MRSDLDLKAVFAVYVMNSATRSAYSQAYIHIQDIVSHLILMFKMSIIEP